jgi:2,3-bisphosphoglycerate-dependent phosphoglycerate mutase
MLSCCKITKYCSLRSIIVELDRLSPEVIPNLELVTGVPIIYDVDDTGQATNKIILN